jgi:hypothetical protein
LPRDMAKRHHSGSFVPSFNPGFIPLSDSRHAYECCSS